MKHLLAAILLLTLTGCAMSKGFDRNVLRERVSQPVTDTNIQAVLNLKPQLPKPFKLAVEIPPPAFKVKVPPPLTTLEASNTNTEPEFTVKFMVLDIVPPVLVKF